MRDDSITYLKALGIVLMVMAHAHIPMMARDTISLFHMPLFYIASGYCFKDAYISNKMQYVCRRVQNVWWPYVKWMILFTLLHNIFFHFNILSEKYGLVGTFSYQYSSGEIVDRCFHALLLQSGENMLGGYWFLKSLFWGSIFFFIIACCINVISKNFSVNQNKLYLLAGVVLLIISLFTSDKLRLFTILRVSSWDFHAALYIWCGYMYKRLGLGWEKKLNVVIPIGIVTIIFGVLFWKGSMTDVSRSRFLPLTFSALAINLMLFGWIKQSIHNTNDCKVLRNVLRFIGNNTLTILTWHFLSFKLVSYILVQLYNLPSEQLAEFPVIRQFDGYYMWILYTFVGLIIPLFLAYLNRYIPNKYLKL